MSLMLISCWHLWKPFYGASVCFYMYSTFNVWIHTRYGLILVDVWHLVAVYVCIVCLILDISAGYILVTVQFMYILSTCLRISKGADGKTWVAYSVCHLWLVVIIVIVIMLSCFFNSHNGMPCLIQKYDYVGVSTCVVPQVSLIFYMNY